MRNIITTMQECDAILQTLIHDIGSHQVPAADLAIRLRTAANLLDPPNYPTDLSRTHGMFQTAHTDRYLDRTTVLDDSDRNRALHDQSQQELDRYQQTDKSDLDSSLREVDPFTIHAGDRIRIRDITLYYRQRTEFIVHRIEHHPDTGRVHHLISRDDGLRKLIYAVGTYEPYLSRTYYLVEEQAFTPEQQQKHRADKAQSEPGQSASH